MACFYTAISQRFPHGTICQDSDSIYKNLLSTLSYHVAVQARVTQSAPIVFSLVS